MRTRRKHIREFKMEAVKLVRERGVTVAHAARDMDLSVTVLRKLVRDRSAGRFPRPGPAEARAGDVDPVEARGRALEDGAGDPKKSRGLPCH